MGIENAVLFLLREDPSSTYKTIAGLYPSGGKYVVDCAEHRPLIIINNRMTPLHHAVEHSDCVALLLEEDAVLDQRDYEGWVLFTVLYSFLLSLLFLTHVHIQAHSALLCHYRWL